MKVYIPYIEVVIERGQSQDQTPESSVGTPERRQERLHLSANTEHMTAQEVLSLRQLQEPYSLFI